MKTFHKVWFQDAQNLEKVENESVDLVVTSPPYPMIEMWDRMFIEQNSDIQRAIDNGEGLVAFELMHQVLDSVWRECFRVLKPGRFMCINIGDATRKIQNDFCLYPNHTRILTFLLDLGFSVLPDILWRKQTNAPNKFMGSGMLPAGAYVTLEHEYILILRKGSKRFFRTAWEKQNRQESAIFWEERNCWYSDVWMDIKGTGQFLSDKFSRLRSAAYPFELVYRLINMYSVKGDVVLDPFLGTGTTLAASMASCRNSVGIEIDAGLQPVILGTTQNIIEFSNAYMNDRLARHHCFVKERIQKHGSLKYSNKNYGFPVVTGQEQLLLFNELLDVDKIDNDKYEVSYNEEPQTMFCQKDLNSLLKKNASLKKEIQPDPIQYDLLSR